GLVSDTGGASVAALQPETLEPVQRSARMGWISAWAYAPDRQALAVVTRTGRLPGQQGLRLFSLADLRPLRADISLGAPVRALAWAAPSRVVALEAVRARLLLVDPVAGK